ncbi:conserved hypothetical protein [Theileria equi strain WA]|uniref:RAP domain-containing protein n=1 Tax=Theileria equi strain WA TaxID=1537102 RepID=L1LGH0_THEEQ|nr:conserved hypothetical protein [Theileria equi strain WA]EKX74369.1 conserved hypothetical protein [Theileria equi strain WA]|eukprot:XP_004833821.1 conserved hypothetical protein [Theileria equi strain WA]
MLRCPSVCKNVNSLRFFTTLGDEANNFRNAINELTNDQIVFAIDTLGKGDVNDRNLLSQLCKKIKSNIKSINVENLLKITHSLAKVEYKKLSLFSVINRILLKQYEEIETRQLTQYLIDLNKLNALEANIFLPLVSNKVIKDVSLFSTFDLCFLLHLTSKLKIRDTFILDFISTEILANEERYGYLCADQVLVATVLRSLAFLKYDNELFRTLLYKRIPSCVYGLGGRELCNVLFAIILSHLNVKYTPELTEIVLVILDRITAKLPSLVEVEINQLGISLYYLKYNFEFFNENHESLLRSIADLKLEFRPSASKMQEKVGRLLDELKLKHESEVMLGPYRLDFVIPKLKVAIEVNGYTHFFHRSEQLNATTELKYKIIEDLGWKVFGLNYYDWKNKNKQERLERLAKGLMAHMM